jgi:hypothetical protein
VCGAPVLEFLRKLENIQHVIRVHPSL